MSAAELKRLTIRDVAALGADLTEAELNALEAELEGWLRIYAPARRAPRLALLCFLAGWINRRPGNPAGRVRRIHPRAADKGRAGGSFLDDDTVELLLHDHGTPGLRAWLAANEAAVTLPAFLRPQAD